VRIAELSLLSPGNSCFFFFPTPVTFFARIEPFLFPAASLLCFIHGSYVCPVQPEFLESFSALLLL